MEVRLDENTDSDLPNSITSLPESHSESIEPEDADNMAQKYKVPDFDPKNVEVWFATIEFILEENGIDTEKKKLSAFSNI